MSSIARNKKINEFGLEKTASSKNFAYKFYKFIYELLRINRGVLLINFCILLKLEYLSWCTNGYLAAPMITSIGILLFVSVPIIFYFPKMKIVASLIFNILVTLFLFTDLVYFRYYNDVFSLSVLSYAGQIGTVVKGIFSLLKINDLFIVADLFILFPLIFNKNKILINNENLNPRKNFTHVMTILLISIPLLLSGFPFDRNDRMLVIKQFGILLYHVQDLETSVINFIDASPPSEEEKHQVINRFNFTPELKKSKLTGFGKGKNLIVIQVESLQNFVINLSVNGQEITPNLNKLVAKSLYFPNFYTQAANWTTSDAEFIVNNSLYPIKSAPVYRAYYKNTYQSLAKILREMGYSTQAMHGFRSGYWNRESVYPAMGFDRFLSESSYSIDQTIGWGLADKSFLQQSAKMLKTSKQPYYAFMITLTSHIPYSFPSEYKTLKLGKHEGTMVGDYLHTIHYVDEALGVFLDESDNQEFIRNSVLVIYGDHWALPLDDLSELDEDIISGGNWLAERLKVPLFINIPSSNVKGIKSIPAGQIDLFPTLANIMGIPPNKLFTMGRDLLNSKKGLVIFTDASYIDANNIYHDATDLSNISEREKVYKELRMSELIIRENMLTELLRNRY